MNHFGVLFRHVFHKAVPTIFDGFDFVYQVILEGYHLIEDIVTL